METTDSTAANGAALSKVFELLQTKDDTTRFVGLSLLRSTLDQDEKLRADSKVLEQCWSAIPQKWLLKLLRSKATEKRSEEEARTIRTLALGVVHTFTRVLPPQSFDTLQSGDLATAILEIYLVESGETATTALEALIVITSNGTSAAADVALSRCMNDDLKDFALVVEKELGRHLIRVAVLQATASPQQKSQLHVFTDFVASRLARPDTIKTKVAIHALLVLTDTFEQIWDEQKVENVSLGLQTVLPFARRIVVSQPGAEAAALTARIIQCLGGMSEDVKFDPFTASKTEETGAIDTNNFAYYFISLVLVDIRATMPSLMEILGSKAYLTAASRLTADYDVLGRFIFSLFRFLDEDSDDERPLLMMTPDLLLKLRKDIAEAMSLTIEFIRDRWDASITGQAGLDPNARNMPETSKGSNASTLRLTWDNPNIKPADDPIIIAGLRVLGVWLREDDNEQLRNEASGITDVLLNLHKEQHLASASALVCLEAIVSTEDGAAAFVKDEGPDQLFDALQKELETTLHFGVSSSPHVIDATVRVLLPALESSSIPQAKPRWCDALLPAWARLAKSRSGTVADKAQIFSDVGQLALILLEKSPSKELTKHKKLIKDVLEEAHTMADSISGKDEDTFHALVEICEGLSTLSH